ncbi:hypothetical protein [Arenimonas metalli]|uniref:Uncharacterized protein n=1 Tax=Arenimonas metalli CF5-1 TaxID=1384056 RepID=A0A091B0A6_9GAMM|nr:hypothetical protein [Arenimonas metalli]KFN45141.1 hypothetical protein N787_03165 [Arenimonas metalli CF5-1]
MQASHRTHLSVFLLAVLSSVFLFSFDVIDRGRILYVAAGLFAFGEVALLTSRFHHMLAMRSRGGAPPR